MRFRTARPMPMPMGTLGASRTMKRRLLRWLGRMLRRLTILGFHHRGRMAPVYAAVMLLGTGLILHRVPAGDGTVPDGTRSTATFAVLAAAGLWWWTWRKARKHQGLRPIEKTWLWSTFTAAMAWLITASAVGIAPPMPGFLLTLMLAAGIPWWWHRRIRPMPAPVMTVADAVDYSDPNVIWQEKVGLTGSWLSEITRIDEATVQGWSALINLPGGKLVTKNAVDATVSIASAYSKSATSVVVEPVLSGQEDLARLLVLDRNPLIDKQYFTGPTLDPETGWIHLGLHADGTEARWRLWVPKSGACHGMIAGTTGSGKSGTGNALCTEISHSGLAVLWLADPEDGESLPDWQDNVDWFAGNIDEIRAQLQAAERIMEGRKSRRSKVRWVDGDGFSRRGKGFFEPTPEEPLLVCYIEEGPDVLADAECRRIVARIGKKGRKVGVAVILITQIPSVTELGGDITIRSMLSSTNVLMFRTSDKLSKQMAVSSDLPVDPATLPITWPDGSTTAGLGYLATPGGRLSPLRGKFVEHPHKWAASRPIITLEPEAEQDAGIDYLTWRERREDDIPPPSLDDAAVYTPPLTQATAAATAATNGAGKQGSPAAGQTRRTARDLIVEYLGGRDRAHTGVIAHDLGIPKPTVTTTLRRMETARQARQVRHGVWALQDSAVGEIMTEPEPISAGAR